LANLQPDRTTRHQNLKGLVKARLELLNLDREIAGQVRSEQAEQRKQRKLQREIKQLLSKPTTTQEKQ